MPFWPVGQMRALWRISSRRVGQPGHYDIAQSFLPCTFFLRTSEGDGGRPEKPARKVRRRERGTSDRKGSRSAEDRSDRRQAHDTRTWQADTTLSVRQMHASARGACHHSESITQGEKSSRRHGDRQTREACQVMRRGQRGEERSRRLRPPTNFTSVSIGVVLLKK